MSRAAVIRCTRTTLNAADRTSLLTREACTLTVTFEEKSAQTMKAPNAARRSNLHGYELNRRTEEILIKPERTHRHESLNITRESICSI